MERGSGAAASGSRSPEDVEEGRGVGQVSERENLGNIAPNTSTGHTRDINNNNHVEEEQAPEQHIHDDRSDDGEDLPFRTPPTAPATKQSDPADSGIGKSGAPGQAQAGGKKGGGKKKKKQLRV